MSICNANASSVKCPPDHNARRSFGGVLTLEQIPIACRLALCHPPSLPDSGARERLAIILRVDTNIQPSISASLCLTLLHSLLLDFLYHRNRFQLGQALR